MNFAVLDTQSRIIDACSERGATGSHAPRWLRLIICSSPTELARRLSEPSVYGWLHESGASHAPQRGGDIRKDLAEILTQVRGRVGIFVGELPSLVTPQVLAAVRAVDSHMVCIRGYDAIEAEILSALSACSPYDHAADVMSALINNEQAPGCVLPSDVHSAISHLFCTIPYGARSTASGNVCDPLIARINRALHGSGVKSESKIRACLGCLSIAWWVCERGCRVEDAVALAGGRSIAHGRAVIRSVLGLPSSRELEQLEFAEAKRRVVQHMRLSSESPPGQAAGGTPHHLSRAI